MKKTIKKIIPFTILKSEKKIGINLIKEVKNLYIENYELLMTETD